MLFLLGGIAVLGGFLLLVYLFVNADPVRLARNLKWTGIVIAGGAVIALLLFPPARELGALLFPLAMSMPLLSRLRTVLDRHRRPAAGQSSTVATAYLRMTLDHDTGSMTGTVLRGHCAGHADRGAGRARSARPAARMPGRGRGRRAAPRSLSRPHPPRLA